jgi:hypothetical protein
MNAFKWESAKKTSPAQIPHSEERPLIRFKAKDKTGLFLALAPIGTSSAFALRPTYLPVFDEIKKAHQVV